MEVSEALSLISRLKNLPDLYDRIEVAVCGLIHRYYDELFELEKSEAEIIDSVGFDDDRLPALLSRKSEIHEKYWSNKSIFYKPCSAGNTPDHVWDSLTNIEVLQNGDDDNSLYIFKARKLRPDGSLGTSVAFILKLVEDQLFIEHQFFG
jgi:hypothetical protein